MPAAPAEPAPDEGWTIIEGPTPHGGVLTEIFFYGESGRARDLTTATRCLWRELDERDRVVHERWVFVDDDADGGVAERTIFADTQTRPSSHIDLVFDIERELDLHDAESSSARL